MPLKFRPRFGPWVWTPERPRRRQRWGADVWILMLIVMLGIAVILIAQ